MVAEHNEDLQATPLFGAPTTTVTTLSQKFWTIKLPRVEIFWSNWPTLQNSVAILLPLKISFDHERISILRKILATFCGR